MKSKKKPMTAKPMTMKEFEGTATDKAVDKKALKKINEKRKKGKT